MQELSGDAAIEPHSARDLLHVRAALLAKIRYFVDESYLGREKSIGCVFDELRGATSGEKNRRLVDEERPVNFAHDALRPFIIEEAGSFHMGVVYQHWLADSASIRMLLREWFVRVYDPAAACDAPAVIPRGGYWAHFGPTRARWRLGEQLLTLLRSASRFRRVRKLRTRFGKLGIQFQCFSSRSEHLWAALARRLAEENEPKIRVSSCQARVCGSKRGIRIDGGLKVPYSVLKSRQSGFMKSKAPLQVGFVDLRRHGARVRG